MPLPFLNSKVTRQEIRHDRFRREFQQVKMEFGSGYYSWGEGMNRQAARKIARKRAKRAA